MDGHNAWIKRGFDDAVACLLILLGVGTKKGQNAEILRAQQRWQTYKLCKKE